MAFRKLDEIAEEVTRKWIRLLNPEDGQFPYWQIIGLCINSKSCQEWCGFPSLIHLSDSSG